MDLESMLNRPLGSRQPHFRRQAPYKNATFGSASALLGNQSQRAQGEAKISVLLRRKSWSATSLAIVAAILSPPWTEGSIGFA
jgi:hypothetical protein